MGVSLRSSGPLIAAFSILASVGTALGDISQDVFVIRAENANGVAEYRATFFDGYFNPDGSYEWTLPQSIMMTNPQGVPIAMLQSASVMCHDDPDVSLNFNVLAGSAMATFTITSAQVSFATLALAEGRSSATVSVTDLNSNGALLTPFGQPGAYTSRYNGVIPGGTTFHDSFAVPEVVASPGGSLTDSDNFPGGGLFSPIAGPVTDINSRFNFTLSAGDLASGTSIFVVQAVPTPGALALLGLGALAAGRRRGR
jgi:MYXO-CTERM domain-containing protein